MHTGKPLSGNWRTYLPADGLAGVRVEHIVEDAEGYLWFATWGSGISRFDGDVFRTFTAQDGLGGDLVYALCCDGAGRLWVGSADGGLCFYERGIFRPLQGGPASTTFLAEDAQGRLWTSGRGALGYVENGVYRDLLPAYRAAFGRAPEHECWGIVDEGEDRVWFGFLKVVCCEDGRFRALDLRADLPRQSVPYAIGRAADGGLWVGGSGWFGRLAEERLEVLERETGGGQVRKIQCDRRGRTWLCSYTGVLCCEAGEVRRFTARDGLACETVNGMCQDREGYLWFATWGGGVSRLAEDRVRVFQRQDEPVRHAVEALLEDRRGGVWMGFSRFDTLAPMPYWLARLEGEVLETWGEEMGLESCHALCEDGSGRIWIGCQSGLSFYEDGRFQRVDAASGYTGSGVYSLALDGEGRLYIGHLYQGAQCGITRFDGSDYEVLYSDAQADWMDGIIALLPDEEGRVYFGRGSMTGPHKSVGLGVLEAGGEVRYYTMRDGLPHNRVEALHRDRAGRLWVGTWGGLGLFADGEFRTFTIREGLPNNQVRCIAEDRAGRLWVGTDGGVVLFGDGFLQRLHPDPAGSTRDAVNGPTLAIAEDGQGHMWFATQWGCVRYMPGRVPPRAHLQQLIADRIIQNPGEPVVTASRQLVFEYRGLSLGTRPQDMLYSCRLQGYEQAWRRPEPDMRAIYRVPPGRYTFQVRAIDQDLNYSEPAELDVEVVADEREERLSLLQAQVEEAESLLVGILEKARLELEEEVRKQTADLEEANERLRRQIAERQEAEQRRTELEEQLRQAQKMEAVGQLTAGVAHNFNNLLVGILGNVQLALEEIPALYRPLLEDAHLSAQRAADIVRQLMLFARGSEGGSAEVLSVGKLLDETADICRRTFDRRIAVSVDASADLPAVRADAAQLQQVFLNLCLNGRDALEAVRRDAPILTLRAFSVGVEEMRPGLEKGAYIQVEVEDNGTGMDEQTRQRIFEPFFTTKEVGQGTGLGLATAYAIVREHRGLIECESHLGEGTVFRIWLPALQTPAHEKDAGASAPVAGGAETILLIDDDDIVHRTVGRMIARQGYQLLEAWDGPEGLKLFRDMGGEIDLVVLDYSMPGLSGEEVLEQIMAEAPHTRVVIFSGYAVEGLSEAGARAVLQKPVDMNKLLQTLRQVLDA